MVGELRNFHRWPGELFVNGRCTLAVDQGETERDELAFRTAHDAAETNGKDLKW